MNRAVTYHHGDTTILDLLVESYLQAMTQQHHEGVLDRTWVRLLSTLEHHSTFQPWPVVARSIIDWYVRAATEHLVLAHQADRAIRERGGHRRGVEDPWQSVLESLDSLSGPKGALVGYLLSNGERLSAPFKE